MSSKHIILDNEALQSFARSGTLNDLFNGRHKNG